MISMNSKSCASWPYLPSFLFCSVFEQETILYSRVLAVLNSYYRMWACNLTERKNLQNSDCRLRFLCENFRLCSRYNNVNYGARYVYKPLFGSSVAIYPPREMVGHSTIWQVAWPCQIIPPLPGLVLNPLEETLLQPVLKTFITVLIIMKGWKINLQELRF